MRRTPMAVFTLALALSLTALVSAQTTPETRDADAFPHPGANESMVRVVHAAPNAEVARVVLMDSAGVASHEFTDLEYLGATGYVPVLAGNYDVYVELAGGDETHEAHVVETQSLGTAVGQYFTIVLTGLVLPREAVGSDDSFLGWLEGLFTAERRDLTLFPMVLDDLTQFAIPATEGEVRLVHAAPGTDAIDLVFVRTDGSVDMIHTESYGNWSTHGRFFPSDGSLQIRAAGSEAVIVDLAEIDMPGGEIHTVILTGTPIDDVPLRAMVVSNPWVDMAATPGAPGAMAPGAMAPGAGMATDTPWIRDRLFEVEAWLESAESRLVGLRDVAGAEAEASEAHLEVAEARRLLEEVRLHLDAGGQPARPAGQ